MSPWPTFDYGIVVSDKEKGRGAVVD